jgi:hypothetical protein
MSGIDDIRERWSRRDIPEQLFSAHVKQDIDYLLSCIEGSGRQCRNCGRELQFSIESDSYCCGVRYLASDFVSAPSGVKYDPFRRATTPTAGSERCAESNPQCVHCGHSKPTKNGFCNEQVPGGYCWCKCVFPAPPEAEVLVRRSDAARCAELVNDSIKAKGKFAAAILMMPPYPAPDCPICGYAIDNQGLCVLDSTHTSTSPLASTPVPAEAAAREPHPIEKLIQQWRNTLSPDSVVTDEDAEDLVLRLIAKRGQPSTATNSAVVEANDLVTQARAFNTEIANCGINPQRAHELIDELAGEVERLTAVLDGLKRKDDDSRSG